MTTIKLSTNDYLNADKIKRIYYSSSPLRKSGYSEESDFFLYEDDLPDYYVRCSIWAEIRNDYKPLLCCMEFPVNKKIIEQIEEEGLNFVDETSHRLHLESAILNDPEIIKKMDELLENTINIIESAKKSDVAILDLNKIINDLN